jgi:transposase
VFIDESGFMLQPVVRRTWAPRGQTPVQKSWDRHDRLSVEAALTVSPHRRRIGLYFRIHSHNVRFTETKGLIAFIRRHIRRKFILVLDRLNAHRKAVRVLLEEHPDRFEPAWLPAYAPELNPVEQVWNHAKYSHLANFIPEDIGHLERAVGDSLQRQRSASTLLRAFIKHADLVL